MKLDELAKQIDSASSAGAIKTLECLDRECELLLDSCESSDAPVLWYYRSNVQAALQQLEDPHSWNWRQPFRERQILYLRQSHDHPDFGSLPKLVRAQVTTNIANSLSSFGRSVEAIGKYDAALVYCPNFAMALGNRGLARMQFAQELHERSHAAVILVAALDDLLLAGSKQAVWDGHYDDAREQFVASAREIESVMDVSKTRSQIDLDAHGLGRSKKEKSYRQWVLGNRLFLNPLNILGGHTIAATDRFSLPEHRARIHEPPQFIAWFNQLKQEYVAARLLLYEAVTSSPNHFADQELLLFDTLDYSVFGVALEKMRFAFRSAYSLLDKVAGFVNAYFHLKDDPERVNLRNVWLEKDSHEIRRLFVSRQNLPLRGLYWLALDIFGTEPSDPDSIRPDAIELYRLRNALEHRCVVLREFPTDRSAGIVKVTTVSEFWQNSFTMMRLARAAIFYLSLAVGREERMRKETEQGELPGVSLPPYVNRKATGYFQ